MQPTVDIIILSKASTPQLETMTQTAIDTCVSGAHQPVNVIVLEQTATVYQQAKTIHSPGEFNYNQYANRGAQAGNSEWVMIANNDLVFHDGWLQPLLDASHRFVSPKCPNDPRQTNVTTNTLGDRVGVHMSGWCFMVTRELWAQIGGFDERFPFWCADDSLIEQCRAVHVLPMLVPDSKVVHLGSRTAANHGDGSRTWAGVKRFTEVYGPHRLERDRRYQTWLASQ